MAETTPSEITKIEWRTAGGSWTEIDGPLDFNIRADRFAEASDLGRVPGKLRIRGEIFTRGIDEHLAMMDATVVAGTLNEIRVNYKTEEAEFRRMTITSVMFTGFGAINLGRRTLTGKKPNAEGCKTPFEISITDPNLDTPTDYITDISV